MERAYRTEEREIDGVRYRVTPFPARQGAKVLAKLTSLIKPAMKEANEKGEVELMVIVLEIVSKMDRPEVEKIIMDLAAMTLFNPKGEEPNQSLKNEFDFYFSANYVPMAKWLLFALEANFGDLTKALNDLAATLQSD